MVVMKMMKTMKTLRNSLLFGVLCLVMSVNGTHAQNQGMQDNIPSYTVKPGPVTLYGLTFSPYTEFFESEDYDGPRWDSLRYLIPELLPDAQKGILKDNAFCDFIRVLSRNYARDEEIISSQVAYMLRPQFPEIEQEPELIDEASLRLHSRDPAKLEELLEMLPDNVDKVMKAKEWSMKTSALVMLHDAALINLCPDYAKSKRYELYSASYYLEKTGKVFPDTVVE